MTTCISSKALFPLVAYQTDRQNIYRIDAHCSDESLQKKEIENVHRIKRTLSQLWAEKIAFTPKRT